MGIVWFWVGSHTQYEPARRVGPNPVGKMEIPDEGNRSVGVAHQLGWPGVCYGPSC